jgi:hypothetical protein
MPPPTRRSRKRVTPASLPPGLPASIRASPSLAVQESVYRTTFSLWSADPPSTRTSAPSVAASARASAASMYDFPPKPRLAFHTAIGLRAE